MVLHVCVCLIVNQDVFLCASLLPAGTSCRARTRPCARCSTRTACPHGNAPRTQLFQTQTDRSFTDDPLLSGKNTSCSASPRSSSDVSLWPTKDSEKKCLEQDEGCWRCDNQHPLAVEVSSSDTSSLSFSGPYILCQVSRSQSQPGSSLSGHLQKHSM